MSIALKIYQRILEELQLSPAHRAKLKQLLTPERVCAGPHVDGDKVCPVTLALQTKLPIELTNDNVKKKLRSLGVSRINFSLFYLFFDIPAMLSTKKKKQLLEEFQHHV